MLGEAQFATKGSRLMTEGPGAVKRQGLVVGSDQRGLISLEEDALAERHRRAAIAAVARVAVAVHLAAGEADAARCGAHAGKVDAALRGAAHVGGAVSRRGARAKACRGGAADRSAGVADAARARGQLRAAEDRAGRDRVGEDAAAEAIRRYSTYRKDLKLSLRLTYHAFIVFFN